MLENCYPGQVAMPDWNQPETRQINRMPPHSYLVPFPGQAECMNAIRDNPRYLSTYLYSLSGLWQTRYFSSVLQMPENILTYRSGFDEVQLPEIPAARGHKSDALVAWPHLGGEQPVRVYRRHCRLPLTWSGLRKRLVLQGAAAAFHVYINGRFVGYSEGSGLPAEFDVTQHIHDQDNDLFIIVWPRCNSSLIEPESELPAAAIFRDLYLEAVPSVSLYDLGLETRPQADAGSWSLNLSLQLISYRISMDQPILQLRLRRDGEDILKEKWPVMLRAVDRDDAHWPSPVQAEGRLEIEAPLHGIEEWNHENPELYDLYLSVEDGKNNEMACYHRRVGFRSLTQDKEGLKISGRPLELKTAIWQESRFWQQRPDIATMVKALRQIKQHHMNALWLKDLAVDPIFLELCDLYGLYVIADLPLDPPESLRAEMNADSDFWLQVQERAQHLILRDRPHPSVIAWSAKMLQASPSLDSAQVASLRQLDSSRFWHYQDLPAMQRPLSDWLEAATPQRKPPFLADDSPWPDGGLAFGSWLPEQTPSAWGIPLLQKDGTPGAYLRQIKHRLRPLRVRAVDAADGAFTFHNRQIQQNASDHHIRWILFRDGAFHLSGELDPISIAPGESQFREIWWGDKPLDDGAQYRIRFEMICQRRTLWHPRGQEAGQEEFMLAAGGETQVATKTSRGHLRLDRDRHHLIVSGPRFWLIFNAVTACLESWRLGEAELFGRDEMQAGMRPQMRRHGDLFDEPWLNIWREKGLLDLKRQVTSLQHHCDGKSALVTFVELMGKPGDTPLFQLISRYEVHASGQLTVYSDLAVWPQKNTPLPPHPGFGLRVPLREAYGHLSWRGKGPQPGFWGFSESAATGVFQQKPAQLPPSHQGGLVYPDCHWLRCENEAGLGLAIQSDAVFAHYAAAPVSKTGLRRPVTIDLQLLPASARSQNAPLKSLFYLRPLIH